MNDDNVQALALSVVGHTQALKRRRGRPMPMAAIADGAETQVFSENEEEQHRSDQQESADDKDQADILPPTSPQPERRIEAASERTCVFWLVPSCFEELGQKRHTKQNLKIAVSSVLNIVLGVCC